MNRILKFVSSQYDSVIPDGGDLPGPLSPNDPLDAEYIASVNGLLKDYIDAMDVVKIRLGLQTVMLISMRGNHYLQTSGLNKALMMADPKRCAQVVSRAINLVYVLSALIYPFMPATSDAILVQLNAPPRIVPETLSTDILTGHRIGKPEHLFKKIEEKMAETWRAKFGGEEVKPATGKCQCCKYCSWFWLTNTVAPKKINGKVDVISKILKTPEILALEGKVLEQGQAVRALKGQTPKTSELDAQIKAAVEVLKGLKEDLATLTRAQSSI